MAKNGIDRRVLHTKERLYDALMELLREKSIDKITTTALCEKADINRNTFYSHYSSPRDLLNEVEENLTNRIIDSIDRINNNYTALLQDICNIMYENADLITVLYSPNSDAKYLQELISETHEYVLHKWTLANPSLPESELRFILNYCTGGTYCVIKAWIDGGLVESPEYISKRLEMCNLDMLGRVQRSTGFDYTL